MPLVTPAHSVSRLQMSSEEMEERSISDPSVICSGRKPVVYIGFPMSVGTVTHPASKHRGPEVTASSARIGKIACVSSPLIVKFQMIFF